MERFKGVILSGQSRLGNLTGKRPGKGVHDGQNAQHPDRNNEDHQPLQGDEVTTIEIPSSHLAYLTQENDRLEKLVKTKKKELQTGLSTAQKENERLESELRERDAELANLANEKEEIKDLLSQSERDSNDRAGAIRRERQENNYLKSDISNLEHQLQEKSSQIQTMSEKLHNKSVEIEFQEGKVRALQSQIETMQATEYGLRSDLKSVRSQKLETEQNMQNEINDLQKLQQNALVTIQQLRIDTEEYSGALLKRDGFIPTTDRDMKSMFREISQDVETLARVEWKEDQTVWTQKALQVMSPHQQSFKKQVLQDMIWGILQQYIFASPFRPFGEEGRKLESAWRNLDSEIKAKEDIGGVYTWPKPSAEIERWRYVNVTEGHAAVTQATVSELDPRGRLKTGFERAIDTLKKELASSLEAIVGSRRDDSHYLRTVEELPRKAVNVWLGFGIQRCRIQVVVRGPYLTSVTEKILQAKAGGWELVIIPELQRIGTSKGSELNAKPYRICDGQLYRVSLARRQ